MLVHTAHLRVHQNNIGPFRARLLCHESETLAAEPGCSKFLVHQDINDSALFLLVEHYADKAALDLHRVAPYYLAFREDVKERVVERNWWFWSQLNAT
jgi:quinol monooxygenase YgiN